MPLPPPLQPLARLRGALRGGIERALASGKLPSLPAGRMGLSTSEVGDLIAGYAGE